jgi:RNA polymerase sigma-70 factor (ECF subfamily)
MTAPLTRPTLLLRLRDKENAQAWQEFVRLYTPLIFGFGIKRGLNETDAAELCQEVMCAVAGGIERFSYDPSRGSFRSWLMTVTRNRFNSFLERQYRRAPSNGSTTVMNLLAERPSEEEANQWDAEYQRRLLDWAAEQVRGEFETSTWEAFWRTAMLDQSGQEVADALGISVGAVYIARSRVIARLREKISRAMKGFGLEPEL